VNGVTTDYVLDINTGLTQVLQDGTNTYLYGVNRIAQSTTTETEYFLADALGSVRNLTDRIGNITLTQSYSPFGEVLTSTGDGQTDYAFTGEMFDPETGLVYLRARFYGVGDGRFVSRDSWAGNYDTPTTLNRWVYVVDNPINFIDPSGLCPDYDGDGKCDIGWQCEKISDPGHRQLCYQKATCKANICSAPPRFIENNTPIYKAYKQLVETPCKLEGDNLSPWWKTKGALGKENSPLDKTMLIAILVYTEASPIRDLKNIDVGKEWITMAGNRLAYFCENYGGCEISKDGRELQYGLRKFLTFSARYPEYADQTAIDRLAEQLYGSPKWAYEWAKEIVKPRMYDRNKPFGGFNSQSILEQKYFYDQYLKNTNKSTEADGVYFSWGRVGSDERFFGDMFLLTYDQIQYHFTNTDFLIGTTAR
jgi:RHS repeat-associated protein